MEKTIHSNAYQALRKWLVEMRHEKNLTQRELASLLGVQYSWIGKVELGERRLDIVEFVRLCKALEVDPHTGLELIINQVEKEP
jgi:transcriptional regulator with XRE-family HTH domain